MGTLIGKTLSGLQLTALLGSGPTGETFVGETSAGTRFAVKVLHGRLSLMDRVAPYWEALQKLERLAHPYILVPSSSKWTSSGRFLLQMDLLAGVDLQDALARVKRLPARQALRFFGQVCLALEAAHKAGVIHGGLAPHNIFLVSGADGRGSARVLDFAGYLLGADVTKDPDRAVYAAPELSKGPPSAASDIFSLGALLFHTMTGTKPLPKASETRPGGELALLEAPAGLREVIGRALAESPTDRFPSVSDLRAALEGWAGNDPPELAEEPLVLFPEAAPEAIPDPGEEVTKKQPMQGVAQEGGETEFEAVHIPFDDLSRLFVDEEPDKVSINERKQARGDPTEKTREEEELAAMAEQASAPLRGKTGAPSARAPVAERADPGAAAEASAPTKVEPQPAPIEAGRSASPAAPQPTADAAPQPTADAAPQTAADTANPDEADEHVVLPLERTVRAFVETIAPIVPTSDSPAGGNGESLDGAFDAFVREAKALSTALPRPIVDDKQLADLAKVPVPEPEPEPKPEPPPPPQPEPVVAAPAAAPIMPPAAPQRSLAPVLIGGALLGGLLVFGAMRYFAKEAALQSDQPQVDAVVAAPLGATIDSQAWTAPDAAAPKAAALAPDVAAPSAEDAAATARRIEVDAAVQARAEVDAAAQEQAGDAAATAAADVATVAVKPPTKKKPRRRIRGPRKPRGGGAAAAGKPQTTPSKPKATPDKGKSDWVDPFSQ